MKRTILRACAACLLLFSAFGLWVWQRPLDLHGFILNAKLWSGGVRHARIGGLEVLSRDTCAAGDADCACVAFIHGLGDSADTWSDLLVDSKERKTPRRYKLFAFNLPGVGASAAPASLEGYGIRPMSRTVREALAGTCPRWTLVGNSLGGWIAADIALQWPSGTDRLFLLNAAGLDDPSGLAEQTARTLADPTPEKMKDFFQKAHPSKPLPPSNVFPQAAEGIRERRAPEMVAALRKEELLDGRLKGIRARTVVILGEPDGLLPASISERYASGIRGARLFRYPDCGHLPQKDCPDEVFKKLF
ncbi:MAG: alpha/beta hydrolase [Elusimicrobiota bacterium]